MITTEKNTNTANINEKRDHKKYTHLLRNLWMACRAFAGSFTVEASWGIPIFLLAVCQIIFLSMFSQKQMETSIKLNDDLRVAAQMAFAGDALGGQTFDDINNVVTEDNLIKLARPSTLNGKIFTRCSVAREFTGRQFTKTGEKEGEIVFVAENGEVYHRSRDCTYISLSISAVSREQAENMRNKSGGKYHPCEKCMKSYETPGTVYITDYGDKMHSDNKCSGLKRTIYSITLEEAEEKGLRPCSKCGGD